MQEQPTDRSATEENAKWCALIFVDIDAANGITKEVVQASIDRWAQTMRFALDEHGVQTHRVRCAVVEISADDVITALHAVADTATNT